MTNHRSKLSSKAAVIVIGLCIVLTEGLAAERGSSLTEHKEIEASEVKNTLKALAIENAGLKRKLEESDTALAQAQKNLTVAISESEEFKRKASELKLRFEALGLEGAAGSLSELQQKLLKVANDLQITDTERKTLQVALIQLSEAVLAFQKVSVTSDSDARAALEAQMRNAAKALGIVPPETKTASAAAATLQDGMVISIKDDLALVVANLGSRQGVKIGMPFQVLREDKVIGTVRVVDVRERIAGAVIQDLSLEREKIQVGDRLKVAAQQ